MFLLNKKIPNKLKSNKIKNNKRIKDNYDPDCPLPPREDKQLWCIDSLLVAFVLLFVSSKNFGLAFN